MNQVSLVVVCRLWCDEEATTAIEYALIAAMITVAITVTVSLIGQQVHSFYLQVLACFENATTCAS